MDQLRDLRGLNLGSLAAENDTALSSYFVRTEAFDRVQQANRWLVLGNRGSGKTAIFRTLAEQKRTEGRKVVELRPEDYSYELARDVLARETDGSWQKSGAFAAAWKWLILLLVMRNVGDASIGAKRRPAGKIHAYLRDNHAGMSIGPMDALIGYLKRIESVKLGKYEAGVQARELRGLFKLDELKPVLPCLEEILQGSEIYVLVDELDRGWDASEDAQYFVSGLFRAAVGLNQEFKGLHVLVSLRHELYESIPALYDDTQKHRDVIESIRWDETRLQAMISERVRVSFPKETRGMSTEQAWNFAFGEILSYRSTRSFIYVVDRTLNRPRELISFCSAIRDAAIERGVAVDYSVITDAERKYSKDRFDDIVSEYRFQYPGLREVFEEFRGRLYRLDRDSLVVMSEEIILSDRLREAAPWLQGLQRAERLIEILWEVGFLLARNVGGQKGLVRSGSQYVGSYHISSIALDSVQTFKVHPLYHSHLQMKEK